MNKILIITFSLFLVGCLNAKDEEPIDQLAIEAEKQNEYEEFVLDFDYIGDRSALFNNYFIGKSISFYIYKLTKEQVKTREAIEKQNEILERIAKSLEKKK